MSALAGHVATAVVVGAPGNVKFVHAADLHLDSPMRGLERYDGAPVERFRGATRRALENLVELCVDEAVDFLLVAGDLYDGDWKDYSTGLFFSAQMSRLREAGIRVFLVRGNHDAASQITRHLELPQNVTELSARAPETHRDESLGLAVHGQSFAQRVVDIDLAARYPDAEPGVLNVGLLHTSLTGREGHEPYAPTELGILVGKGYDYWALGHVHRREIVCEDPWVVYPGNLQGRHVREPGAKGATLVVSDGAKIQTVEHRTLDVVRWGIVDVDVRDCMSADDVLECTRQRVEDAYLAADGRTLAVRVVTTGHSSAHEQLQRDPERWENEIRAQATDIGADNIWVERVRFDTRAPYDVDEIASRDDALGQLLRSLRELRSDTRALEELSSQLDDLRRWLPREAKEGPNAVRLDDPDELSRALEDVEQMLLPRLLGGADSS